MSEWTVNDEMTAALMNQKCVYIGSGAPDVPYEGQFWVDISTDPPTIKMYDLTNTAWMPLYPIYYETQSAEAWADPTQTPITNGTIVIKYNSHANVLDTRIYVRSNSAWANLDTASSPTLTGNAVVSDVESGKTFYKDDYTKLTGTLALTGDAEVGDVEDGKFFYKDGLKTKLEGTLALDGNAVEADVKSGVTFFSNLLKTKKTGTLSTAYALGDGVLVTDTQEHYTWSEIYEKLTTINVFVPVNQSTRFSFEMKAQSDLNAVYARIYRNDVEYGSEQSTTSETYVTKTEDLVFSGGDTAELYGKCLNYPWGVYTDTYRALGTVTSFTVA